MKTQVSYTQSEYGFQQDTRRCKIDSASISAVACAPMNGNPSPNDRSSFGLDMYSQASLPFSEYSFRSDRKRCRIDNDNISAVAREQRHEYPRATAPNNDEPRLLWRPEDKQHLTELHCFVRKHCVFIFCATSQDVGSELKDKIVWLIFFCSSLSKLTFTRDVNTLVFVFYNSRSSKKRKEKGINFGPNWIDCLHCKISGV